MRLSIQQTSAAKTLPFILFGLAMLALAGCAGANEAVVGTAASIWETRPDKPPPPDLEDQMAQHESWCYSSMGYPECYSHPQEGAGPRLINVDPQNRYPMTPRDYYSTVVEDQ